MDALVLDTNIVSYLMRGDTRARAYQRHIVNRTLAISFMTVGELYEGAYRKPWSEKRFDKLRDQIKSYLVLPFTSHICEIWGRIRAERKNRTISVNDGWIAATALAYGCPLVTHNSRHFTNIAGLPVITEQTAEQE